MGRIIRTNGSQEPAKPKSGGMFSLEEMQAVVGGYIEIVQLASGEFMVVNEEGKLRGLPENPAATVAARAAGIRDDDVIVGDVLVCGPAEID